MVMLPWAIDAKALKRITVLKTEEERTLAYAKLVTSRYNQMKVPSLVGFAILIIFAGLVFGFAAARVVGHVSRRYGSKKSGIMPDAVRKHLLEAPLWGDKHAEPVQMVPGRFGRFATIALPLRGQTMIIGALVLANLLSLVYYPATAPGLDTKLPQVGMQQLIRYAADRAGILATAQLPLVILLAGRNSPVSALTGVGFDTLMLFHRWVARIIAAEGLLHAIFYTWYEIQRGNYQDELADPYFRWGIVAVICMVLMSFLALRALRVWWYEGFVIFHILMAVFAVAGLFSHIALLKSVRFQVFVDLVWVSIAFWAFDRFARYARMVLLNLNFAGVRPVLSSGEVTVVPGSQGELISVRVKLAGLCRKLAVSAMPGTDIMLHIPRLQPLSSHPFSVIAGGHDSEGNAYVDLLIKVCSGITERLKNRAAKSGSFKTLMFVEGPYATRTELAEHDGALLVTGGVGIAHTLSSFVQAISTEAKSTMSEKEGNNVAATRYVELLWFARSEAIYGAVLPYLTEAVKELRAAGQTQTTAFKIHLSCTGNGAKSSQDDSSTLRGEEKQSEKSTPMIEAPLPELVKSSASSIEVDESLHQAFAALAPQIEVQWSYGARASISDALAKTQEQAASSNVIVITCGPPSLIDSGRAVARTVPGKTYHEAPFGW